MPSSVWTIALAGGNGTRLASVTGAVPKQYWRRSGAPTLLEETLRRLAPVTGPDETVVVAAAAHRMYLETGSERLRQTRWVLQPRDRGTAAGVALGLLPVLEHDADAVVVITPADHGVRDERVFHEGLRAAILHADRTGDVVLCGVEPTGAADDYGWILPGPSPGPSRIRPVVAFLEKPEPGVASALLRVGAVWNTMVTVARARTLLDLKRRYLPELAGVFIQALRIPPSGRTGWLQAAYDELEPVDFSRDLMVAARGLGTMVWPSAMGWSDLGTPERLRRWDLGLDRAPTPARPGTPVETHASARGVRGRGIRPNPRGPVRLDARSTA